jgi:hypothetical protein
MAYLEQRVNNIMRANEFITEMPQGITFNPDNKTTQEIANLYSLGFTLADISKEYPTSQTALLRVLKSLPAWNALKTSNRESRLKQGLSIGPKGTTADQLEQMARIFASGESYSQIGDKFDLDIVTVRRLLKKLPNFNILLQQNTKSRQEQGLLTIQDLTQKNFSNEKIEKMAREYALGTNSTFVGKMFNISNSSVLQILKKLPNWGEIKFQNRQNRLSSESPRVTTKKQVNKPYSKGIGAIRRTGGPSGGSF